VKIGKHEDKVGLRLSPTNEVIFDDVRIPAANIIGAEGKGFGIAMRALEYARVATMSFAVCIMIRTLDEATKYAKERTSFGKLIIKFQGLSWMLADMTEPK